MVFKVEIGKGEPKSGVSLNDSIKLLITVTYSIEKEIPASVPLSAIESATVDRGIISDIDQLDEDFLCKLYKDNGIDPATIEDQVWEIVR